MGARRALLDHGRQRTGIVKSKGYKAPQEHPERARACLTRPELQPKANPRHMVCSLTVALFTVANLNALLVDFTRH
jgi:hypothetical protein